MFEGQIAFFELLDDRVELGDRGFEILDRRVWHLWLLSWRRSTARTDFAVQFPARKGHAHAVSAGHGRCVAQHARLVGVPRDSVPPPQDGKRAERVEPAGAVTELQVGP